MNRQVIHVERKLVSSVLPFQVFNEFFEIFLVDSLIRNHEMFETSFSGYTYHSTVVAGVDVCLVHSDISVTVTVRLPE